MAAATPTAPDSMAKNLKIARLRIYPVKALEGMDVDAWDLDAYGLRLDRRWMIVDSSGQCITRREQPSLAAVKAEIEDDRLVLSARHLPSVELPLEPEPGPTDPAIIRGETIAVRDISDDASRWLSEWLRTACRLVYLPGARARTLDPALGTRKGELAFQDELPLQVLSAASLDDLNARLASTLAVEAARPNLLIRGGAAYEEDTWRRIRISGVEVRLVKPWTHEVFVPPGGSAPDDDALAELASYRGLGDGGALGQLAIHSATTGQLRIGDVVEILERGEAPPFEGEDEEPEAEDVVEEEDAEEGEESEEGAESGGWFRRRRSGGQGKKVRVISLPESQRPRGPTGEEEDAELPWEAPEPDEEAAPAKEPAGVKAAEPVEPPAPPEVEEPEVEEPEPEVEEGEEELEVVVDRVPDAGQVTRLLAAAAVTESKGEAKRLAEACLKAPILVTAWKDGALIGLLRGWTDEVRDGFIADVAVHPDHHGSGAAQHLVQRAVELHPRIRWVLRASPGSAYLGSALGWEHAGSGWYLSPR